VQAMSAKATNDKHPERRSENRTASDRYYSVEFTVKELASAYQFKIWNISSQGMCVLVKEGSKILPYLHVGDVITMKYYLTESLGTTEDVNTKIKHITKDDQGRFKGHYLVGLAILT
jgi:hypothetical protein